MSSVRVTEIYLSIQGESTRAGRPCVFLRLAGCPLRCRWCDTTYAFSEGTSMEIEEAVSTALEHGIDLIEVTGGEPLAQPAAGELLERLCDNFSEVLLETSGAYPIEALDRRVSVILDMKAPGSGETKRNIVDNISHLRHGDELKIVIADRRDYEWAKALLEEHSPAVPVHFSPVHGEMEPRQLADWILADRLTARLQLQQHKYIWDPEARGV